MEKALEKLSTLPEKPGVYLFKDSTGQVLYVGKAAALRHRVSSYFRKQANANPRLQLLLAKIDDLDYILCDSELEALLLEYNLIKEHHPPYNVRFRDDKRYPLIKVVMTDPFPYITIARKRLDDRNRYFGPYVSTRDMRKTLKTIRKIFQIRSCTMKITGHDRPCLYYHLKECTAPCIAAITQAEYRRSVDGVIHFLEGNGEPLVRELTNRMKEASLHLEFERAAIIRDQLESLQQVMVRQKVASNREGDEDYVGIAEERGLSAASVFHVRQGKLIGKDQFVFESVESSLEESFSAFIEKYYQDLSAIPSHIFSVFDTKENTLLEAFLTNRAGHSVKLEVPKRGEKKQMLDLLEKNARHHLELALFKETRSQGMMKALQGMRDLFLLPTLPFRIEGYDISTLFGEESVGSMVVFQGGKPEKSHYRKFAIQRKKTPDDFAMMEELLSRRIQRLSESEEDPSFSAQPDLILLDGGRGQLSVGVKVLTQHRRMDIPILSLAKEEEEIYLPTRSKPIKLSRHDAGLRILQQVRDEAHRFAISFHKQKRGKKMTHSILEEIAGVGKKRVQKLLEAFGSLDQVKVALPEQIAQVLKCSRQLAEKILQKAS